MPENFESMHKYKGKKHHKGSKSSGDGLPVDREAFNFDSLHQGQSEEKCGVCELRRSPRKHSSAETCNDGLCIKHFIKCNCTKKNAV